MVSGPDNQGTVQSAPAPARKSPARTVGALIAVLAVSAGIAISIFASRLAQVPEPSGGPPTAARYDAVARYDAARKARRPVYILFHSVT